MEALMLSIPMHERPPMCSRCGLSDTLCDPCKAETMTGHCTKWNEYVVANVFPGAPYEKVTEMPKQLKGFMGYVGYVEGQTNAYFDDGDEIIKGSKRQKRGP